MSDCPIKIEDYSDPESPYPHTLAYPWDTYMKNLKRECGYLVSWIEHILSHVGLANGPRGKSTWNITLKVIAVQEDSIRIETIFTLNYAGISLIKKTDHGMSLSRLHVYRGMRYGWEMRELLTSQITNLLWETHADAEYQNLIFPF